MEERRKPASSSSSRVMSRARPTVPLACGSDSGAGISDTCTRRRRDRRDDVDGGLAGLARVQSLNRQRLHGDGPRGRGVLAPGGGGGKFPLFGDRRRRGDVGRRSVGPVAPRQGRARIPRPDGDGRRIPVGAQPFAVGLETPGGFFHVVFAPGLGCDVLQPEDVESLLLRVASNGAVQLQRSQTVEILRRQGKRALFLHQTLE